MESWNDDRLGELARDVKGGFARVEGQIKEAEGRSVARMDRLESSSVARMDRLESSSVARMDRLESSLEKLQYWIWGIGATLLVGVIAHFV